MAFGSDVPASYVEFMSEMLAQTPLEVVADFYPAFAELDEYEALRGARPAYRSLVIGGEDDMITPVEHTDRIIELLPDADVACGCRLRAHGDHRARTRVFNEVLEDLLKRVRAAR